MSVQTLYKIILWVALIGLSATCFISCGRSKQVEPPDKETLITMQSTDHILRESKNGRLQYQAETPLMERYQQASQPYMEFRKGIQVETYNDTTYLVESTIIADYAKFIEPLELWEARGNVVVTGANGQILETEQLFWDQKIDKIYSNVDSKVTQGDDVMIGVGFESNSKFDKYIIRQPRGQVAVDAEQRRDTTTVSTPASTPISIPPEGPSQEEPHQLLMEEGLPTE